MRIREGSFGIVELRGNHAIKLSSMAKKDKGILCGNNLAEMAILGFVRGRVGVVRVHSMGTTWEGELRVVMERGVGMDEWLARLRQLQGMEGVRLRSINAVRVLRGLLAAVVGLHRLGLAHMDIKPANVVLWFEGEWVVRVALIDFGACRLVASWCPLGSPVHAMGTYDFAAPETFSSTHARPSFACDAFSVGAVMYELVHGQPLIRLGDMEWGAVAARWRRWQEDQEELGVRGAWEFPPLSGGFSKEMVGVVRRLLVEDPARRVSLERLYAEFEPEGRLLEPLSPPRVLDPPLPASGGDWGLRWAGLAFLSLVCPSPMAFPLAANIYARYRGGVWSQPSRGEARVVRAAACLAQVVKFPDSRVTDAYAGEVGALVDAFGTGGCLSDTAERVLALAHGVHTPDCELLWRAVAGAHGAREQAALYMSFVEGKCQYEALDVEALAAGWWAAEAAVEEASEDSTGSLWAGDSPPRDDGPSTPVEMAAKVQTVSKAVYEADEGVTMSSRLENATVIKKTSNTAVVVLPCKLGFEG